MLHSFYPLSPSGAHDDVTKWKHFPRYWPFVRGIHRSQVNSPHKGQWRGALMFSLICVWISGWVNNREAGELRRYRAHYDVSVMYSLFWIYVLALQFSEDYITWWHCQMETFSALLGLCVGNSSVTGEFPTQRPVTRSFDVFFDLRLNKRLGKQSRRWWFETPSCSLWRRSNELENVAVKFNHSEVIHEVFTVCAIVYDGYYLYAIRYVSQ